MGWMLIALGVLAAWLLTLGTGILAGWAARDHEDSRAGQHRARDGGGRGASRAPAPRPPLTPFPGQFLLEIEEPDHATGDTWHTELIRGADEVRARLDEQLDRSLRVIRGEAAGE